MEQVLKRTCRIQLTKIIQAAKDYMSTESITLRELEVFVARVSAARNNLCSANEKALPTIDAEKLEEECEKIADYDDAAVTCIARLQRKIEDLLPHVEATPAMNVQRTQQLSEREAESNGEVRENKKSVRLPKLELLKYNGDVHAWSAFWEQFKIHIHENKELDEIAKFSYLKSLLTGQAAITIKGLTSSQVSYQDAIDMLREEFGKTDVIIDNYVQDLLSLAPAKSRNDLPSLRKLYNTASTITRSLQALGISANQYGIMIKSILLKALPYAMRIDFNKQLATAENINDKTEVAFNVPGSSSNEELSYERKINKLLNYLKIEIDSVQRAQAVSGDDREKRTHNYKSKNWKNESKNEKLCTAAGLLTSAKENCLFCQSSQHYSVNCNGNLTVKQKKNILSTNARCFKCTRIGHRSKFCKSKISCNKCKRRHATTLCDPDFQTQMSSKQNIQQDDRIAETPSQSTSLIASSQANNVYLQTACAFVETKDRTLSPLIRTVLDNGSQMTFIRENISRKLKLPVVSTHNVTIAPFGSKEATPAKICKRVAVRLRSHITNEVIEFSAIEVPEICFDSLSMPSLNDRSIKEFAIKFPLADMIPQGQSLLSGITILIGADNYWKVVTNEYKVLSNNLTAVNTKFGWTLLGVNGDYTYSVNLNVTSVLHLQTNENEIDITKFWSLEMIGISAPKETTTHGESTQKFMNEKITFENGRYKVLLPWAGENKDLDSNYNAALIRAKMLTSRLIKNSKLIEYDIAMREYEKTNCAELVPKKCGIDKQKVYYMPHKPVYRENRDTTRVRVVFDASAHAPGLKSLNEMLLPGENLVPELLRVLINFRIGKIGLIADIEKAFLQIVLDESERDSHSFLWFKDQITDINNLPDIVTYRMKRVTFGVTCSPFLLAATLRKHFQQQGQIKKLEKVCEVLLNSFYVDDLVVAVNCEEIAQRIYDQSRYILSSANMNLRKWATNDVKLKKYMEYNETESTVKKILGIQWCTVTDELFIDVNEISKNCIESSLTKRSVLQIIAKIYDPMGFFAPFVVRGKLIMQSLWKKKLDWDEILPTEIAKEYKKWFSEIILLKQFSVPRCIVEDMNHVELHIFADASPQAFGSTAYLRSITSNGDVRCHLLIAKGRVAPINEKNEKSLTLPRLELTAALCGARLQDYIVKNLNIKFQRIFLWSDSKITLHWIKGKPARWKPYIANRVIEIQNLSRGTWRHCPGTENPADHLTRGVSAKTILESELWHHGPTWLNNDFMKWPTDEYEITNDSISVLAVEVIDKVQNISPIFEPATKSSYMKIIFVTAYVMRFINNLRSPAKIKSSLRVDEIRNAENYWIKFTQSQAYKDEITSLARGDVVKLNSKILTLNPFLDNKTILRLGGRLQEAALPYSTRHPAILPKRSILTERIIWDAHMRTCHSGVNSTLAEVRKNFWIIQGRQCVKSVISRCIKCRKLKCGAASEPFAPLPRSRITLSNPFKVSGIDFAGPLFVKSEVTQTKSKTYIMLITCAVVRAVHLELVPAMDAESCIRGLRRFIARRGVPSIIYSDNAKTFKRVSKELNELTKILSSHEVQSLMRREKIDWRFIVERAAWWGGFWERMVHTVKTALKLTIGKASLTFDELQTELIEVESAINSRPLTYINNDPDDLLILTPSHFLVGNTDITLEINSCPKNVTRSDIIRQWEARGNLQRKFWKRWSVDYLQQLRTAHHNVRGKTTNLHIGDVVILHDQNLPRLLWKLARITKTFTGRDNRIRACEIRTGDGTTLRRPIQLLYPLEIPAGEDVEI